MAKYSFLLSAILALTFTRGVLGCCTACNFCCPNEDGTHENRQYCCTGQTGGYGTAPSNCTLVTDASPPNECSKCCLTDTHQFAYLPQSEECLEAPFWDACETCYCCMGPQAVPYYCDSQPPSSQCIQVSHARACPLPNPSPPYELGPTSHVVLNNLHATYAALDFCVPDTNVTFQFKAVGTSGMGFNLEGSFNGFRDDGTVRCRTTGAGELRCKSACGCSGTGASVNLVPHGALNLASWSTTGGEGFVVKGAVFTACCPSENANEEDFIAVCVDGNVVWFEDPPQSEEYTQPNCETCQCE